MTTKKKKMTANAGAAQIIKQVIAHVETVPGCKTEIWPKHEMGESHGWMRLEIFDHQWVHRSELIKWLQDWDKRAQAKPGRLGRKKAAK